MILIIMLVNKLVIISAITYALRRFLLFPFPSHLAKFLFPSHLATFPSRGCARLELEKAATENRQMWNLQQVKMPDRYGQNGMHSALLPWDIVRSSQDSGSSCFYCANKRKKICALTTSLACWKHLFWIAAWASWIHMIISTPVINPKWSSWWWGSTCLNGNGPANATPGRFSIGSCLDRRQVPALALIVIDSAIPSGQNLESCSSSFLAVLIVLESFWISLCFLVEVCFFICYLLHDSIQVEPRDVAFI